MAGSMQSSADVTAAREVVIYDGSCAFCVSQVDRIRRRDRDGRFEYAAWQTEATLERFPQLARAELSSGMRLVQRDGTVLVGADAVHGIFRRLRYWRRVAWLYRVPVVHRLCRWTYGWIAANRYRLAGRCATEACDTDRDETGSKAEATSR